MKLLVTLEPDEAGMLVAECPAIPGCVSQGRTEAQAIENIRYRWRLCGSPPSPSGWLRKWHLGRTLKRRRFLMPRIAFSIGVTFLTAAAFWIPFGTAQTNPPAKLQREVKFEILSLRPVKPGAGLSFNDRPTPNGYRATLSIWQTIMLAYTTDDSVTWGATQLKNDPNWLGDFYDIDARVSQTDLQACQQVSEPASGDDAIDNFPIAHLGLKLRKGEPPLLGHRPHRKTLGELSVLAEGLGRRQALLC